MTPVECIWMYLDVLPHHTLWGVGRWGCPKSHLITGIYIWISIPRHTAIPPYHMRTYLMRRWKQTVAAPKKSYCANKNSSGIARCQRSKVSMIPIYPSRLLKTVYYIYIYILQFPRHPNSPWEGVLGLLWGSKYLLSVWMSRDLSWFNCTQGGLQEKPLPAILQPL